jgi:hypothetical protein
MGISIDAVLYIRVRRRYTREQIGAELFHPRVIVASIKKACVEGRAKPPNYPLGHSTPYIPWGRHLSHSAFFPITNELMNLPW